MKKWIVFMFLPIVEISFGGILQFREQDAFTKHYVVNRIAEVIPENDIAIIQFRDDEALRKDHALPYLISYFLHLHIARNLAFLKGAQPTPISHAFYLQYLPTDDLSSIEHFVPNTPRYKNILGKTPRRIVPYTPTFDIKDGYLRLVFLKKEYSWNTNVFNRSCLATEELQNLSADAERLPKEEFLAKHKLAATFSNLVYTVAEDCIFHVDYSPPELPPVKNPFEKTQNAGHSIFQVYGTLLHLSSTEVSEIVYLAYRLKGYKEGRAEYKRACTKNPQILKPVEKLQTEIGRMLAKELYPKGLIEFKDGEKE